MPLFRPGAEIGSVLVLGHYPEIFAFGLLFRLQEYIIAWGWAPLSDLSRVDMLDTIAARPDVARIFYGTT